METTRLSVHTGSTERIHDLTRDAERFVSGRADGLLSLFVPHATAGLALLELGSGSDDDLLAVLRNVLPSAGGWRHEHGSPGHGRTHVLPAIVSPSLVVPVLGGRMALGTWQSIALVDLNVDNPVRTVLLSFLAG
jgi:secondary thiamine-phosphate synthase enzyme